MSDPKTCVRCGNPIYEHAINVASSRGIEYYHQDCVDRSGIFFRVKRWNEWPHLDEPEVSDADRD